MLGNEARRAISYVLVKIRFGSGWIQVVGCGHDLSSERCLVR